MEPLERNDAAPARPWGWWLWGLGFLAAMALAGAFDLGWVWMLAEVPDSDALQLVGATLLEGRAPGLPDVVLGVLALAGGWFLLGLPGRAPRLLRYGHQAAGRLALAGLATLLAGLALRMLLARPGPMAVLAGRLPFAPWYAPPGPALAELLRGGSFPALSSVLAGLTVALAWQVPERFGELRQFLVVAAFCGAGVLGLLEVYAQHHWPTDVVAGTGLAVLVPWLLLRRRRGRLEGG